MAIVRVTDKEGSTIGWRHVADCTILPRAGVVAAERVWAGPGALKHGDSRRHQKADVDHAAIARHLRRYKRGERRDADSGEHPLSHVIARCCTIIARDTAGDQLP